MPSFDPKDLIATLTPDGLDTKPSKPEAVHIAGISASTGQIVRDERAFQWWPESLSDNYGAGWNPKSIPGGSHALMSWGANESRTFSFEVYLSRVTWNKPTDFVVEDQYNVDIPAAIAYLRSFCYPSYPDSKHYAEPPPIAALYFPNMGLSEVGDEVIYAVMTACNVTYSKTFLDGTPKLAQVSLEFTQTVQIPGSGVQWVDGEAMYKRVKDRYNSAGRLDRTVIKPLGPGNKAPTATGVAPPSPAPPGVGPDRGFAGRGPVQGPV